MLSRLTDNDLIRKRTISSPKNEKNNKTNNETNSAIR